MAFVSLLLIIFIIFIISLIVIKINDKKKEKERIEFEYSRMNSMDLVLEDDIISLLSFLPAGSAVVDISNYASMVRYKNLNVVPCNRPKKLDVKKQKCPLFFKMEYSSTYDLPFADCVSCKFLKKYASDIFKQFMNDVKELNPFLCDINSSLNQIIKNCNYIFNSEILKNVDLKEAEEARIMANSLIGELQYSLHDIVAIVQQAQCISPYYFSDKESIKKDIGTIDTLLEKTNEKRKNISSTIISDKVLSSLEELKSIVIEKENEEGLLTESDIKGLLFARVDNWDVNKILNLLYGFSILADEDKTQEMQENINKIFDALLIYHMFIFNTDSYVNDVALDEVLKKTYENEYLANSSIRYMVYQKVNANG